jgi:iron complex transport system ATP-binding protein
MTQLKLIDVSVRLSRRIVLEGASCSVEQGEWAALIGPNGAGKTTTLRAIAGVVGHGGRIEIAGHDAAKRSRRWRAQRVAVVPQTPTTPPDMTVRDYVLLGRTPHLSYFASEGTADRAAADRAIERLDLAEFSDRLLPTLSGGERQRAVLARALAQEAEVLLLDEPTTALDLARQQQVLDLVDGLRRQERLTVVAAMHDLTSVALYADRVHLMSSGRLVTSGAPDEVLRSEVLSEHFGARVRVIEHDGEIVVAPARAVAL